MEKGYILKSKTENGNTQYDFQYCDKDSYRVTIEGLSRSFDKESWNYAKLISGVLRHGMPLPYVVDLVTNLDLHHDNINTWKNGVVRALKKYIENGTQAIDHLCPSCDDPEGSVLVGPTTSGDTTASYTFQTDDGSTGGNNVLFVNQASGDPCANENQIQIRVFSTQQDFEVVQSGLVSGGSGLGTDTNGGDITTDGGEEDGTTPPTTSGGTSVGLSGFNWNGEALLFLAMFMIGTTFLGL